ncbi:hypothetical protein PC112_g22817, partial [Phytophthora cactorum]
VAFGESRKYRDVSVVPDIYAMMPMELRQQLQSKQLRTMFLVLAKSDRKDLAQAEEIMHDIECWSKAGNKHHGLSLIDIQTLI